MKELLSNTSAVILASTVIILTMINIISYRQKRDSSLSFYFRTLWIYAFIFLLAEFFPYRLVTWGWGIFSFFMLREYFTLANLRVDDRYGIIAAYFSVPFMMHFIHTDWYGMFIISIPVYSFIFIPIVISLSSRNSDGAVLSLGIIDYGLFTFVYCIGHLAYLLFNSPVIAGMLVINVVICDLLRKTILKSKLSTFKDYVKAFLLPLPLTIAVMLMTRSFTGLSLMHSLDLAILIPALVVLSNHTIDFISRDLKIDKEKPFSGYGRLIINSKSIFYTAPIVFHYVRYFILK